MAVRSLLQRVTRLEQARAPARSPIERWHGSLEAFEDETRKKIEAGALDRADAPILLRCIRAWHEQGLFGMWQREHVWEFGR